MTSAADERIGRLYGLPLEEFTAERNALASELRAAGDSAGAAAVKALRKPTAAAWAVNQLVRTEPDLVEALLGAGGELRQAHRQAASGRGADQLRAAADAERAAVDLLVARAPAVLGRALPPALAEAVRNSLRAASSDDEARERVSTGTLVTEMRPVGLGPAPASPARSATKGSATKGGATKASATKGAAAKARAAERAAARADADAAREAQELARAVRAAAAEESALQRELGAAERALDRADESYARAREAADAAAERAKEARKRLREARAGLADARRKRAQLERD